MAVQVLISLFKLKLLSSSRMIMSLLSLFLLKLSTLSLFNIKETCSRALLLSAHHSSPTSFVAWSHSLFLQPEHLLCVWCMKRALYSLLNIKETWCARVLIVNRFRWCICWMRLQTLLLFEQTSTDCLYMMYSYLDERQVTLRWCRNNFIWMSVFCR